MPVRFFKELIAFLLRSMGIMHLIRNTIGRSKVTLILYHNPTPEKFSEHIKYLKRYYTIITLDVLVDAINQKDWSLIPVNSLVVTIDDGYKENYELRGVLKEFDLCPVIYLSSHFVNTNRCLWFQSGYKDFLKLKHVPQYERLAILKSSIGYDLTKEYPRPRSLNLIQMNEMSTHCVFASHSMYHSVLTALEDKECCMEISKSKETLESMLGRKILHFSYPNGDYGDRELAMVKQAGYRSARTCDVGWNGINTDPYKLKAMGISDDASINVLALQVSGIAGFFRYALRGSFNGQKPGSL